MTFRETLTAAGWAIMPVALTGALSLAVGWMFGDVLGRLSPGTALWLLQFGVGMICFASLLGLTSLMVALFDWWSRR